MTILVVDDVVIVVVTRVVSVVKISEVLSDPVLVLDSTEVCTWLVVIRVVVSVVTIVEVVDAIAS